MKKPIKAAILGMGGMGNRHAGNLMKLDGVSVVGLCGRTLAAGEKFNAAHACDIPVFDDFDTMLAQVEMDALFVCLPPNQHNGQIEAAAEKGIHIFAEKPLALTLERAQSIADAVKKHRVLSQVGYNMRFVSAVSRLKELIDSGVAGKPTLFTASFECNDLHSPWWSHADESGGQVFEQVIHLYDLAMYTMGDVAAVSGFMDNLCHQDVPGYTIEDTSAVTLLFKNGAMAAITGSNCAVPGDWKLPFYWVFENLIANFRDANSPTFIFTKEKNRGESVTEGVDTHRAEVQRFIDVLRGEKAEFASIAEGLAGLRVVAAAVESAKNRGAVQRL